MNSLSKSIVSNTEASLVRLRIKDEGEAYYFKYPYNPYAVVKYRIDDPAAGEPIK